MVHATKPRLNAQPARPSTRLPEALKAAFIENPTTVFCHQVEVKSFHDFTSTWWHKTADRHPTPRQPPAYLNTRPTAPHNARNGTIRRSIENANIMSRPPTRANRRPTPRRPPNHPARNRPRRRISQTTTYCTTIHHKPPRPRRPKNDHPGRPCRNRRQRGLNVMTSTPSPKDVVCLTSRMPDLDIDIKTTSSVPTDLPTSDLTP